MLSAYGPFAVVFKLDALAALPAALMGGDGFVLEVNGEDLLIGLERDLFADCPGRDAVGIASSRSQKNSSFSLRVENTNMCYINS